MSTLKSVLEKITLLKQVEPNFKDYYLFCLVKGIKECRYESLKLFNSIPKHKLYKIINGG